MIPMDRARNSDQFTFLKFENPSTGSKVRSHQSWALFVIKSIFLPSPSSKIRVTSSNLPKITIFGPKFGPVTKKSITFEPLDGFSKFKCLNALKFCQEFNKHIRLPRSVAPDPRMDPDPAKKAQIHRSELLIMRWNSVYNKIIFFEHVGEGGKEEKCHTFKHFQASIAKN